VRVYLGFVWILIFAAAAHADSFGPPKTWTGFYVGVNAGVAWTDSDFGLDLDPGTNPIHSPGYAAVVVAAGPGSANDTVFTGGGQIGFNFQSGGLVFGLEGDFNSLRAGNSRRITGIDITQPTYPFTHAESATTDWLATIRPRIGFLADPSTFIYVTGGLALTEIKYTYAYREPKDGVTADASGSEIKAGWTVGGGGEWAIDGHWSLKAEYLYAEFDDVTESARLFYAPNPSGNSVINTSADLTVQTARAGLNYRF
jgi:outer membrane immunogenic protein